MSVQKNPIKRNWRLAPEEPSTNLLETIIGEIETEKRLAARRRFAIFSFVLAASAVGFIPAYQFFRTEFYASGFYQFLSLIFSDPEIAIAYWQDFALSLLETLPIISSAVILGVTFTFLISLKNAVRDAWSALSPSQLIQI